MARFAEQDYSTRGALVIDPDGVRAAHTEYRVMPEFRVADPNEPASLELVRMAGTNERYSPYPLARLEKLGPQVVRQLPAPIYRDITPPVTPQQLLEPVINEIGSAAAVWDFKQSIRGNDESLAPATGPWFQDARMDPLFYPDIPIDSSRSVSVRNRPTQPVIHQTPSEVASAIRRAMESLSRGYSIQMNRTATIGDLHFTEILPVKNKDPLLIWDSNPDPAGLTAANKLWLQQELYACMAVIQDEPFVKDFFPDRQQSLLGRAMLHGYTAGTIYLSRVARTGARTVGEVMALAKVLHGDDGRNILRSTDIF